MTVITTKPVSVACDHAGRPLAEQIIAHLEKEGVAVIDHGAAGTASVDYPVYADKLCRAISDGKSDLGILVCGTGVGMSMAANKHKGMRAAVVSDTFSARLTRMHNDANVLCLGARVVGAGLALDIVDLFLTTSFEGGRHQKRVDMLNELDKQK